MEDFALIVGINDYPNFRPLGGAILDAEDFRDWVVAPDGGAVPAPNVRFVASTATPLRPIQDEIDDAIASIHAQLGDQTARRFYFYFSGHGVGESFSDTAACLGRWSEQFRRAGLDLPGYARLIAESGQFQEIALFLDCCRVRLLNAGGNGPMIAWPRPAAAAGQTRMFTAYATEFQALAYEAAVAGEDVNRVRGHFTRALLAGLRGGAAVATGGVPASRLKSYIEKWTPILAAEQQQQQKPQVDNGFDGVADPIFGSAKPTANVRITLGAARKGEIIVEDGDLNVVLQQDASTAPFAIAIKPGLAMIRETGTGDEKSFKVLPGKGVVDVDF